MSIDSIEQKVIDILNEITGAQPGEIVFTAQLR